MGYSPVFKEDEDYRQIVAPFIDRLPKEAGDAPISITYPKEFFNKVKWKWYDWLYHHAPTQAYRLTTDTRTHRAAFILTISLRYRTIQATLEDNSYKETEEIVDELLKNRSKSAFDILDRTDFAPKRPPQEPPQEPRKKLLKDDPLTHRPGAWRPPPTPPTTDEDSEDA